MKFRQEANGTRSQSWPLNRDKLSACLHHRLNNEDGVALVWLVLALPALLGALALVTDLGLARMERARMQTAADTAALEGARELGAEDQGRESAARMADALLGQGSEETRQDADGWPQVELNRENQPEGDLVVGSWTSFSSQDQGEDPETRLADRYFRPTREGTAFAVRLRRHGALSTRDNQPGVSSSGPLLPWVFGSTLLSLSWEQLSKTGLQNPMAGIRVQTLAIAEARPALRVGMPTKTLPGALPFHLKREFWETLPPDLRIELLVDSQGQIRQKAGGERLGWFNLPLLNVGDDVPDFWTPGWSAWEASMAFVPISQAFGSENASVVVGFGFIQAIAIHGTTLSFIRSSDRVAPTNASAIPAATLASRGSETMEALLAANRALAGSLLAPVLTQ